MSSVECLTSFIRRKMKTEKKKGRKVSFFPTDSLEVAISIGPSLQRILLATLHW